MIGQRNARVNHIQKNTLNDSMQRYDIINSLIKKNNYKKYLEIGIQGGECFSRIDCENKIGVDPDISSLATIKTTSNSFFKSLNEYQKFDLIFIDGLHTAEQVNEDIENSLLALNEDGYILLHDCNPSSESEALPDRVSDGVWMGTVYLSIIKLRLQRDDLCITTVNTDAGVGILTKNKSEKLNYKYEEAMNWKFFENHKNEILNLISPNEFNEKFIHPKHQ